MPKNNIEGKNFKIVNGEIIKDGKVLPVKEGVTPVILPEKKRNPLEGQARWKDASLLNTDQRDDEMYQKKQHIP